MAGDMSKEDLKSYGSQIRQSEDTLLDIWSKPGFFLAGGAAVLALLLLFVVLEAT